MTEHERRRGGRPALSHDGAPSAPVCVRLPPEQFDAAHARAVAERVGLPSLVRRAVARYLADPDADGDE